MTGALALLPVLLAVVLLVCRVPTWLAAAAGLLGALVCAFAAFPTPPTIVAEAAADYLPLVVEVALILLFGMLLAAVLSATGAMHRLSGWVQATVPSVSLGVALVVFGIVPFAESVTGFGIGVTIGVPILRHLGCSLRHSALLGLLGLVAVPWGALGPGTTVAAALTGLDVDALGVSTAWANAIPVGVVVVSVVLLTRPSPLSMLGIAAAAALLWAGILLANLVLGMAPAGIVGSLLVIAGLGLPLSLRSRFRAVNAALGRAVLPYGTLTVGILLARAIAAAAPSPLTAVLASPPVWLAVACLVAALVLPTADTGEAAEHSRGPLTAVAGRAVRAWVPIGTAAAGFMLMGWVMTTTGMSEAIGALMPSGLLLLTPWLMGIAAVLTGSNTGSNAMFAATLASAAGASGAAPLTVVAAGNAAGSLAALAAPPRVAMAVQLAGPGPDGGRDSSWVFGRALLVVGLNTVIIGLWLQLFA